MHTAARAPPKGFTCCEFPHRTDAIAATQHIHTRGSHTLPNAPDGLLLQNGRK